MRPSAVVYGRSTPAASLMSSSLVILHLPGTMDDDAQERVAPTPSCPHALTPSRLPQLRRVEPDRHRAVVVDLDEHVAAEAAGGDGDAEGLQRGGEVGDEGFGAV